MRRLTKLLTDTLLVLTSNIPGALNRSAVLALVEGGATSTCLEITGGIHALVIAGLHTGDRACSQVRRAKWGRAGLES